jgi:hypothetical protein
LLNQSLNQSLLSGEGGVMRTTKLCTLNLTQTSPNVFVQPYGGQEAAAFGGGEGVAEGDQLRGAVRWFNHPRRRSDGVMLPDIQGVITTDDGTTIVFSMQGRVVWSETPDGPIGDQLMRVTFEADDPRYRWLCDAFCIFEGKVIPPSPQTQGRPQRVGDAFVYVCVNELP